MLCRLFYIRLDSRIPTPNSGKLIWLLSINYPLSFIHRKPEPSKERAEIEAGISKTTSKSLPANATCPCKADHGSDRLGNVWNMPEFVDLLIALDFLAVVTSFVSEAARLFDIIARARPHEASTIFCDAVATGMSLLLQDAHGYECGTDEAKTISPYRFARSGYQNVVLNAVEWLEMVDSDKRYGALGPIY